MDATPVGALYDSLLQSALRQFFERATLDTEPTASGATDGRLAIEPSANPSALIIRWFGTRYTLRVPGRWPFTAHEVRLAQAIGAVLAALRVSVLTSGSTWHASSYGSVVRIDALTFTARRCCSSDSVLSLAPLTTTAAAAPSQLAEHIGRVFG